MRLADVDLAVLLKEVADVAAKAEAKYGPFEDTVPSVRLALAALDDELAEALEAWRRERRRGHFDHTRVEVLQVAGVALRLAAALTEAVK